MIRKPAIPAWFAIVVVAALPISPVWGQTQGPMSLGFKKRFVVEVRNPSPLLLENHPVVLNVEEIRAFAPDFNTSNYALFDETGGGYRLVVSQADDFNKDRTHEEIIFVRTLPPSSTTRLACYYSPKGSFQLMMTTPKAGAHLLKGRPGEALAAWESNLAAFKFIDGRVESLAKLYPGLILTKNLADDAKLQEWGQDILPGSGPPGLGGLSVGTGGALVPLTAAGAGGDFFVQRSIVAAGPIRALVKVEFTAKTAGAAGDGTVVFFSAVADNVFSRQDIFPAAKTAGRAVYGIGVQRLGGEDVSLDKGHGFLSVWGRGTGDVGEIGLAVLFSPVEFAGLDETAAGRTIRLNAKPGKRLTVWTVGGWARGIVTAAAPAATNWARFTADLASRLGVPLEVRFRAN